MQGRRLKVWVRFRLTFFSWEVRPKEAKRGEGRELEHKEKVADVLT